MIMLDWHTNPKTHSNSISSSAFLSIYIYFKTQSKYIKHEFAKYEIELGQSTFFSRENAVSQCSSTRHYGAKVTHAILLGKAQTTFNKRVRVPEPTYVGR